MMSPNKVALWAATVVLGAAVAAGASAAKPRTYILNGYSFGPMPGVDTAELEAKLPQKAGARITDADVARDGAIISKELEDRHIGGHLFASVAERHGHVWVILDLLDPEHPNGGKPRFLQSQTFQGASKVSPADLAAATGLKQGAQLWPAKVRSAEQAIVALYAKATPGQIPTVRARVRVGPDNKVDLTWIIAEK